MKQTYLILLFSLVTDVATSFDTSWLMLLNYLHSDEEIGAIIDSATRSPKLNINGGYWDDDTRRHNSSRVRSQLSKLLSKSEKRELSLITRLKSSYGWSPSSYPNPIHDPKLCGIEQVLKTTNESTQPLFICDPSSILSQNDLLQVDYAINNFTEVMQSSADLCRQEIQNGHGSQHKMRKRILRSGKNKIDDTIHKETINYQYVENAENQKERKFQMTQTFSESNIPVVKSFRNIREKKKYPGANYFGKISSRSHWYMSVLDSTYSHERNLKRLDYSSCRKKYLIDLREIKNEHTVSTTTEKASASVRIAVAIVDQIDLQAALSAGSFYTYEDEDDMINDAAQYFARYLYDSWDVGDSKKGQTGILIFLSIHDHVCFISTGSKVSSVLPWWRLERVINDIKTELRHKQYGKAIIHAINDLTFLLLEGPPTVSDRLNDFFGRFGVVIIFAIFTFIFAIWGEYRDRWHRWQITEDMSRLSQKEKIIARKLQIDYRCTACPICLEPFIKKEPLKKNSKRDGENKDGNSDSEQVAYIGSDGRPLKLLRCGHVFDQTCWKSWVSDGQGNPYICPICRQNVGGERFHLQHDGMTNSVLGNDRSLQTNRDQTPDQQRLNDPVRITSYGTLEPNSIQEATTMNHTGFDRTNSNTLATNIPSNSLGSSDNNQTTETNGNIHDFYVL